MKNISDFVSRIVPFSLLTVIGLIITLPQGATAQAIGAWETSANGGPGQGTNWSGNPSIWVTNTGTGYVMPAGNTPNLSYPDTNTATIALLSGAFVTNTSSLYANQLTVSNGAILEISSATVGILHNPATTYDWDIFGNLTLNSATLGSVNLGNSGVIAIESGGTLTNASGTLSDLLENYNATNVIFLNGSLFVMTGTKAASSGCVFPLATWGPTSTAMFMPSAGGIKFPSQITNQVFGNFIWNWPLQSGASEPSAKTGNITCAGTFAVYSSSNQEIEDIPGSGSTLTAGNILITNCAWFPTSSAGTLNIIDSGNFIIDSTAEIKINNSTAICDVMFDGTAPQTLAIYGTNGSEANFNWMVNPGATVDLGANLTNTVGAAGAFTNNGWVDLEGNVLVTSSNFFGSGIFSNTVGAATLIAGSGFFNGSIVGGAGTISLTVNGSNTNGPTILTLSGVNTYAGDTTVGGTNDAILALIGSASLANSAHITVGSNTTFDVSGLSRTFALGASQTLSNTTSTAIINGGFTASSGAVSLTYAAGTPAFTISNGTFTLAAGTGFKINNTGTALPVGTYSIITNTTGSGGAVGGTAPSSVTVTGGGIAASTTASLQISGGMLNLVVSSGSGPTPQPKITKISISGTTLTINAMNGVNGAQFTLYGTTNLLQPLPWTPIFTNNFNGSGNLNLSTNIIVPGNPHEFYYILEQP